MVLCEIGNSFFHFYKDGKSWREPVKNTPKTQIDEKIYFISVNEKGTKKLLSIYPEAVDIAHLIELDSSYVGLGIDRAAACLAVEDGVILDAGSAITVDIMHNGVHLGGFILPGLNSYIESFKAISMRLDVGFNMGVSLAALPQNTQDAISFGVLKSITLLIKDVQKTKQLYCTGGDGKFFAKFFENAIFDNLLIFKGMIKALKEHKWI